MAPIYDYKGYSADGKLKKGFVEAENQKAGRAKLKKQGMIVTEMTEKTTAKPSSGGGIPFFGGRVGIKDISLMTRQLASLSKANIPLVDSLNALVEQTDNEKLKVVLSQVRDDVNEGLSLSKSVSKHPKVFDTIFVNMIEAGESSGTLGLVLIRLADLKEAQMRLKNKVVSAATYPALMAFVSFSLMIAIFTFIIPQLAKIFESMGKPMPLQTQILINISAALTDYWYVFVGGIFFAITSFRKWIASTKGRAKWDAMKLKFPVAGDLIRTIAVTRFSSTMATLLGSGVPILASMSIARNLVDNVPIAKAVNDARENITEGQSIAEPLKRSGEFPPMMIHMISIGEKTGELPSMLQNVADTYEEQINAKIDSMTSLIEPLMIVFMGGAVAFIVMSVFLPMLSLSDINTR